MKSPCEAPAKHDPSIESSYSSWDKLNFKVMPSPSNTFPDIFITCLVEQQSISIITTLESTWTVAAHDGNTSGRTSQTYTPSVRVSMQFYKPQYLDLSADGTQNRRHDSCWVAPHTPVIGPDTHNTA